MFYLIDESLAYKLYEEIEREIFLPIIMAGNDMT
ncbi:hypothetical protein BH10BAC3_BH10BAC3_09890 [soil metagenome]